MIEIVWPHIVAMIVRNVVGVLGVRVRHVRVLVVIRVLDPLVSVEAKHLVHKVS